LEIGADNVLYCTVDRAERGRIRTRFLRNAYYTLARHFEQDGNEVVLRCAGRRYVILAAKEASAG
jgi:hypothetical protein